MVLRDFHKNALDHFRSNLEKHRVQASEMIAHIRAMTDLDEAGYQQGRLQLTQHARVVVHFHPDRLDNNRRMVIDGILSDGSYGNQFASGISNGGLSASMGGARERWENLLFGEHYGQPEVPLKERPKYGALDFKIHSAGPAPRFGSCYFVLKAELRPRCSFTFLDSSSEPKARGTWDDFDAVLSEVLVEAFSRETVLGVEAFNAVDFWKHLQNDLKLPYPQIMQKETGHNLNNYVEAQIHGPISLAQDIEALVCDPSLEKSAVHSSLEFLSQRFGIPLLWHRGFQLKVADVPRNFRGPFMPSLAENIAPGGLITAEIIGRAARENPKLHQELKYLWHVLVRYGQPFQ